MIPYEPTGLFREGFTLSEVNTMLTEAKKTFIENGGEQIVSWSSAGNQATTRLTLTATEMIKECVYALKLLDPENYPPDVDRTTVSFHDAPVDAEY